jgi:sirohydrochlorin ferrochelatase
LPHPHRPPRDPLIPLVGLAHGSRHAGVRPAIDRLLSAVAETEGVPVRAAYLDLAEPDLSTVADELAAAGYRSAVVVPLLFTSAFHATVDVPQAIEQASVSSGLDLAMTAVLGTGTDVEHLLRKTMADAGITPEHSVLLFAVGSSNAAANDGVHALADRLNRDRPGAVRAGFATAAPRGLDVLAEVPEPIAVVPLFLAPGLLLDPMAAQAADRGWPMIPPLAERVAPIVARRYRELVAARSTSSSTH